MTEQKKKPMRLSYTDIQMRRDSIEQLQIEVENEKEKTSPKFESEIDGALRAYDHLIKLLLIGDSAVGKSSLLLRFCDDSFSPSFISTVGIDFKIRTIHMDGKRIKLQIWDTAGQERFRTITTAYYRGAMGILFCYDVTSRVSFDHMHQWVREVLEKAPSDVDKMLVGCKCDLQDQRAVGKRAGMAFAEEHKMQFFEVSAKEATNVEDCFLQLTRRVASRVIYKVSDLPAQGAASVITVGQEKQQNSTNKSKCCK